CFIWPAEQLRDLPLPAASFGIKCTVAFTCGISEGVQFFVAPVRPDDGRASRRFFSFAERNFSNGTAQRSHHSQLGSRRPCRARRGAPRPLPALPGEFRAVQSSAGAAAA